jgi:hypothetical protein
MKISVAETNHRAVPVVRSSRTRRSRPTDGVFVPGWRARQRSTA